MSIPKSELKRFAKVVSDAFLDDKSGADLQGTVQDHIDTFVIPIMTEIEDIINGQIADKIRASFETNPLDEDDALYIYITRAINPSVIELQDLQKRILRISQPTQEAIQETVDSFPGNI